MEEAAQNSLPVQADPDVTLAAPRFDAVEAQTAQPVVPLADVPARARVWPLLLAAVLGGVVSGAALYLYQQPRTVVAPAQQQGHTDVPTETAPPAPTEAQASTATSAAEQTVAANARPEAEQRAPIKPDVKIKNTPRATAHDAATDARARRIAAAEATRAASARRTRDAVQERPARAERPRIVQPRRAPQRNVDRIRDIFEGTRPPV